MFSVTLFSFCLGTLVESQCQSESDSECCSSFNQDLCPDLCEYGTACDCDGVDQDNNCAVCHSPQNGGVGCSECNRDNHYFKVSYNQKCSQCQKMFGTECLHCADFLGCQQCVDGYERAFDQECGVYFCRIQCDDPLRQQPCVGTPLPGSTWLFQSDFDNGTVIIDTPNTTVELCEDIIFNPRCQWDVSPNEQGAYTCSRSDNEYYQGCDQISGSYRLGFFAAISIITDNVELNLNGFTLSVDPEFLIQQRFFTLIGIGQGPFISSQGPSNFSTIDLESSGIHIENGILGKTSHHGILGNYVSDIEINNLFIHDFEVAAIQFNGFNNIYLHDLDIGPSSRNVPTTGKYSQARFGLLSFYDLLDRFDYEGTLGYNTLQFSDHNQEETVEEVLKRLIDGMDLFFDFKINDIIPEDISSEEYEIFREAYDIFNNKDGLPDGSALYGIILNSPGVAVNWFGGASTTISENVLLENILIHDLIIKVNEVVGYENIAGDIVTGPYKGVLDMTLLLNLNSNSFDSNTFDLASDSNDNYNGNLLSNAQIALAMFGSEDTELEGNTIDDEFINWSIGNGVLENGKLVCNGDDMFHMNKGVVGIRIDRTNNVKMKNIKVDNINNWSIFGSQFCHQQINNNSLGSSGSGGPSFTSDDSGFNYDAHPETPDGINNKYQGGISRGIALTDVTGDVFLIDIDINGVYSTRGSSIGIDVMGSETVLVGLEGDIRIDSIGACSEAIDVLQEYLAQESESFPNHNVYSCGLFATNIGTTFDDSPSTNWFQQNVVADIDIGNINGGVFPDGAQDMCFDNSF